MKISILLIYTLLFLLTSTQIIAQSDSTKVRKMSNLKEKLILGGNIGANFGTTTFIEVSPRLGYKVTEKFVTGIGINYNYYSNSSINGSLFGPSVYARLDVIENFFLHSEFQQTYAKHTVKGTDKSFETDFPMFLVGAGGYTSLGGRSRIGLSIMYDIIENPNNLYYSNPIIRGGVMFGL